MLSALVSERTGGGRVTSREFAGVKTQQPPAEDEGLSHDPTGTTGVGKGWGEGTRIHTSLAVLPVLGTLVKQNLRFRGTKI